MIIIENSTYDELSIHVRTLISLSSHCVLRIVYIRTYIAICDQACENQPCPHKLHLVRYSTISSVLKWIFLFCKPYKILHEFMNVCFKFRFVAITKTGVMTK